jgi:trimeric autotransporter adhesin
MSQHDFNIANQSFPATRTDLNNALQALASNSSGDAEPSTTFANQWWYETDTNTLKLRNEANNAWLSFATVDQSTAAWTLAHDVDITGTLTSDGLTVAGATSLTGNLTVDGGTIKLDGNYPVGTGNVALGNTAFNSVTTGAQNVSIGNEAGYGITSGSSNTAVGTATLFANDTGGNNVAVGRDALASNTSASYNTAVGYQAAHLNSEAVGLTAIGARALYSTVASDNTAVGTDNPGNYKAALEDNTTGRFNLAVGGGALGANSSGSYNSSLGHGALGSNTSASNNTAVGFRAGYTNETGFENVFVGNNAGFSSTSNRNTMVGNGAGYSSTGEKNTFVGANGTSGGCGEAMTTGSKNTILGGYTGNQGGLDIRTSSNNIVLSDGDGNVRAYWSNVGSTFLPATAGITTGQAANFFINSSTGELARSTSSLRYKNTVEDAEHGLTELLTLRPVTYKGNNDGDTVFGGLIAEEVHDAGLTEFVQYNDDGEPDALAYSNMVSLCIKAIQEQQVTITALTARITALEGN